MPRTVTGQPYDCRVPMTGIGAKHQCGDGGHHEPTTTHHPGRNGTALCHYLRATVNFQVRHEAGARSAVEEFTLLFEKAQGVPKDAPDSAHAGAGTLSLGAPPELYASHKDRANASPK